MMEKIYKASVTRRNEEEYRGTYDIYVGYFKSLSNGWKGIADFIRNEDRLPRIHIISYKKIDGEFVRYNIESDIIFKELLPDIEQGKIRLVNNYGSEYYFFVEPIEIEDDCQEPINKEKLDLLADEYCRKTIGDTVETSALAYDIDEAFKEGYKKGYEQGKQERYEKI